VSAYNQPGYRGEYWLTNPGTVYQTKWSPNRLSFDVSPSVPTTLVINQNFDIDWQLAAGIGSMTSDDGRLAINLPPGHQQLTLVYRPEHMVLAFLMTLCGAVAFVLLWWWERPPAARGQPADDDARERRPDRSYDKELIPPNRISDGTHQELRSVPTTEFR